VLYVVFVETASDNSSSDSAVLDYAMCVNKVLQMQRVFLTEHDSNSNQPSSSILSTAYGEGALCKDEPFTACSSLAMDTDSAVDSSSPQAAVTLPSQTAAADEMDLSHGETGDRSRSC